MTQTILHVDSSPMVATSVTRKLTAQLMADLQAQYPGSTVITRDVGVSPMPHIDGTVIGAYFTPVDQRSAELQQAVALSDTAVAEIKAADIIVLGVPMWNFGIPSALKAWIDHIARAGETFRYGANGPEGLLSGKRAIIVSARGGIYSQGPMASFDHQENYLRDVLGFIGIKDVAFIRAEGLAMGPDSAAQAMMQAQTHLAASLTSSSLAA